MDELKNSGWEPVPEWNEVECKGKIAQLREVYTFVSDLRSQPTEYRKKMDFPIGMA